MPNQQPHKVFGQLMSKKGGGASTRYQRQFGGGGGKKRGSLHPDLNEPQDAKAREAAEAAARKRARQEQGEIIDAKFGYHRLEDQHIEPGVTEIPSRRGWVFQMLPTTVRMSIRRKKSSSSFSCVCVCRHANSFLSVTDSCLFLPPSLIFHLQTTEN